MTTGSIRVRSEARIAKDFESIHLGHFEIEQNYLRQGRQSARGGIKEHLESLFPVVSNNNFVRYIRLLQWRVWLALRDLDRLRQAK